jgi:hypothetical protein
MKERTEKFKLFDGHIENLAKALFDLVVVSSPPASLSSNSRIWRKWSFAIFPARRGRLGANRPVGPYFEHSLSYRAWPTRVGSDGVFHSRHGRKDGIHRDGSHDIDKFLVHFART